MPDNYGTLRIRAFTAGGALPVRGAIVRVIGSGEGNGSVVYSVETDADGITARISLPAPNGKLSLSPSPSEFPYALYDLEITAEGYYTKTVKGISVFEGVETVQQIAMIPGYRGGEDEYPRENLNYVIPDSQLLN